MSDCPICDGFLSSFGHRCPPLWAVRDADDCDDQDWQTIRSNVKRFSITFDYSIDYHAREA